MIFSYNWLSELIENLDAGAVRTGQLITLKTAECEGVHAVGAHLNAVCAARVESVRPIEGGHNVQAVVDTGRYGVKTVVCGAPNCPPGMVTAYVPAGVTIGAKEIRKAVIGGVESDGMLASGSELGINRDHAGILEIDAAPGQPIPGCAPDYAIEVDNKSITNRPDLWGHHGLAREVAALTNKTLREPVDLALLPSGGSPVKVEIEDFDLCPRYSALAFDNVSTAPSPLWLQYRLESIGLNPISNIVDVTNFIMAELAQPMHAFDADKLQGDTIYVRSARAGESLHALNGETYALTPANLVIADASGPIALAGVIGGMESAISDSTRRIVFESACFNAISVRKTSSALKLRTDASMRFEKSQDPSNTVRGLARAVDLLHRVSPGITINGGVADTKRALTATAPIWLPLEWLRRKLGEPVTERQVTDILQSLGFGVNAAEADVLSVTVPSWRATKDVSIKEDLAEEVGRLIGYESITPQPPLVAAKVPPRNERRAFHRRVREMAAAQGFDEVYNYSFLSEDRVTGFSMDPEEHIRVSNPIASDQTLLRRSLLPGIHRNILDNSRHFDTFRIFEIGYEIHPGCACLPVETPHFAAACYSKEGDGTAQLLELKRLAECLMPGAAAGHAEPRPFEHPARVASMLWRGEQVGRLFEMHPSVVSGRAGVLDLDLSKVESLGGREVRYRPIRRFPASGFDLSVIAGARERAGDIQELLSRYAGTGLESIEFLRQYTGQPLPEDKKSVSYRLVVAAPDHTLSSDEVTAVRNRIIEQMQAQGYELRV